MAERKVKQWITVNGRHIPIFEGESKEDVARRLKEGSKRGKENRPETLEHQAKKSAEYSQAKREAEEAEREHKETVKQYYSKKLPKKARPTREELSNKAKADTRAYVKMREAELEKDKAFEPGKKSIYFSNFKKKEKKEYNPLEDENFSISERDINGKKVYVASQSSKMNGIKDVEKHFETREEAQKHVRNEMAKNAWTWDNMKPEDKARAEKYDRKVKEYDSITKKEDNLVGTSKAAKEARRKKYNESHKLPDKPVKPVAKPSNKSLKGYSNKNRLQTLKKGSEADYEMRHNLEREKWDDLRTVKKDIRSYGHKVFPVQKDPYDKDFAMIPYNTPHGKQGYMDVVKNYRGEWVVENIQDTGRRKAPKLKKKGRK